MSTAEDKDNLKGGHPPAGFFNYYNILFYISKILIRIPYHLITLI